ncbi:hypothetical protein COLO4_01046 [Corchorus olitorius]|uniref:Uncharacterized protein n=1 Tax=Corchorus olitorius TaxID=93759 RepID=A0A1R3L2Z9_9ROSI|nr:hypothetical protein COLO4_04458 [Corchorus olitorius]OMP11065.1 hypothetical protein COLO4_04057 [Corchorus olitorius]OMP13715.1 hypothetical protein COLO4_01095 [Corchorus olitorius]OMP13742.1 hypothetical protein COLO4_01046 [Corchorus olitorius]
MADPPSAPRTSGAPWGPTGGPQALPVAPI